MTVKKKGSTQPGADQKRARERCVELRTALLTLHKTLVDSERVTYEATVGKIQSSNHFLQLLTTDPWFAWLQPLSQLIVVIDEAMDAKKLLKTRDVDALEKQISVLLVPSEESEGFGRHYFDALQRDPDVVLAHAAVGKLRKSWKAGS